MSEAEWELFNLDVRALLSEGLDKVFDGKTLNLPYPLSERSERLQAVSPERIGKLLLSAVMDARTNEAIKFVVDSSKSGKNLEEALNTAALFSLQARVMSLPPEEWSAEIERIKIRLEANAAARSLEPTWQEISGAKRAALEDREIEWREKYSFRWLHDPRVRFACDPEYSEELDAEGEPIIRAVWAECATFGPEHRWMEDGIRDAYQTWEKSDRKQKAKAWLFGKLGAWNMDWECLVIIERALHDRFMGSTQPFDVEAWALIPEDWTPES